MIDLVLATAALVTVFDVGASPHSVPLLDSQGIGRSTCLVVATRRDPADAPQLGWICRDTNGWTNRPGPQLEVGESLLWREALGLNEERWLLGKPGRIVARTLAVGSAQLSPEQTLLVDPELAADSLATPFDVDLDGDGTTDLWQRTYDGLVVYRRQEAGFQLAGRVTIEPEVSSFERRLVLRGLLGVKIDGAQRATWFPPRDEPGHRLSVTRVPFTATSLGSPCINWVDTRQAVSLRNYRFLGGTSPRLALLTTPADKVELFGKQTLSLAPLQCDPTGRGRVIDWSVETDLTGLRRSRIQLHDLTGDGSDDLIVNGFSGTADANIELGAYPYTSAGQFGKKPLRWSRDLGSILAETVVFDYDVDGDGFRDLFYVENNRLQIIRGLLPDGKRFPLARDPSITATVAPDLSIDAVYPAYEVPGVTGRVVLLHGTRRPKDPQAPPTDVLIVVEVPQAGPTR